MKQSMSNGIKVSTEKNNALPHVVPPRTPGEKAINSEISGTKKQSPAPGFVTEKLCFQPGMSQLPEVQDNLSGSQHSQPAPGPVPGLGLVRTPSCRDHSHCNRCHRAGFVSEVPA